MANETPKPAVEIEIAPRRLTLLTQAVELDVDKEDFPFESDVEQTVWDELCEEHEQFVARLGRVWIAA